MSATTAGRLPAWPQPSITEVRQVVLLGKVMTVARTMISNTTNAATPMYMWHEIGGLDDHDKQMGDVKTTLIAGHSPLPA